MDIRDNKVCTHQTSYPTEKMLPAVKKPLLLSDPIEHGQDRSASKHKERSIKLKGDRLLIATRLAEAALRYE